MTLAQRTQFALVLTLITIAALGATCSGCVPFWASSRAPAQQYNAAVMLHMGCVGVTPEGEFVAQVYDGTGTVIGPHSILTAAHMTACPIEGFSAIAYAVDPGDGRLRPFTVDVVVPGADIATLKVADDLSKWLTPVTIGPVPKFGETVCESSAAPRPTYRCGLVQAPALGTEDGDIRLDLFIEHGNSGSGLYDSKGRLVGVVVLVSVCQGDFQCQGRASSLASRKWLVP